MHHQEKESCLENGCHVSTHESRSDLVSSWPSSSSHACYEKGNPCFRYFRKYSPSFSQVKVYETSPQISYHCCILGNRLLHRDKTQPYIYTLYAKIYFLSFFVCVITTPNPKFSKITKLLSTVSKFYVTWAVSILVISEHELNFKKLPTYQYMSHCMFCTI